jgi:hypothetical protein
VCPAGPPSPSPSPPLPTSPLAASATVLAPGRRTINSSLRTPLLLPSSDRELTSALGRCESEREVALVLAAWCRHRQRRRQQDGEEAPPSTFPINAVHAVAALTRLATLRQRRRETAVAAGGWAAKKGLLLATEDTRSRPRREDGGGGGGGEGGEGEEGPATAAPGTTAELVASLLSPALAAAAASGSLDSRGAANAAWALAKLGDEDEQGDDEPPPSSSSCYAPPPELLEALARLAPTSSFAEPRHHSMALWAVARWERRRRRKGREEASPPPPLLPAGALSAWLARAAEALFSPSSSSSASAPQAVANALHAAAELAATASDDDASSTRRFAAAFVERSTTTGGLHPLPAFSPQQAACAGRALALLLPSPPPAAWLNSWLAATEPLLERGGPQALSLLLWSLPALLPPPERAAAAADDDEAPLLWALDAWLAAFRRHSQPLLPAFDDRALAVTCSAMAKVAEWRRRRRRRRRAAVGGGNEGGDGDGGSSTTPSITPWLSALERATLERLSRMPASCLAPTLAGTVRLARLSSSTSASAASASPPPLLSTRWLAAAAAASAPLMPSASDEELRAMLTAVALGGRLASSSSAAPSSPGAAWRALCHRELASRVSRMGAPREALSVAGALLALDSSSPPPSAAADDGGEAEAAGGAPLPPPPPPAALVRAIAARLEAWLVDAAEADTPPSPRDVALAAWLVARLERRWRKLGAEEDQQQRQQRQQQQQQQQQQAAAPSFWAAALRAFGDAASSPHPDDASRLLWAVAVATGEASPRPDAALMLPVVQAAGEGLERAWRRVDDDADAASSSAPPSPLDATADALDALARLGFYPGGAWLRAFFSASAPPALERAVSEAAEAEASSSSRRSRRRRHGARRSLARVARALSALGAVDAAPEEWCAGWARAWRGCGGDYGADNDVPGAGVAALLERAAAAATTGDRASGDNNAR